MAYSIAKAVIGSVKGYGRPGGRASASFPVKYRKSGNVKSFGKQKQGVRNGSKGSINSGGNFGAVGF